MLRCCLNVVFVFECCLLVFSVFLAGVQGAPAPCASVVEAVSLVVVCEAGAGAAADREAGEPRPARPPCSTMYLSSFDYDEFDFDCCSPQDWSV
jgi:hypothetical protein